MTTEYKAPPPVDEPVKQAFNSFVVAVAKSLMEENLSGVSISLSVMITVGKIPRETE
jgi:hypothetical protein